MQGQGAIRTMNLTQEHRQTKALKFLFQMKRFMESPVLTIHKLILLATMKRQMRSHNSLAKIVIMMKTPSRMAMRAVVRADAALFVGILHVRAVHRQTGGLHPRMQPRPFVTANLLVCNTSHVIQFKILSLTAPL